MILLIFDINIILLIWFKGINICDIWVLVNIYVLNIKFIVYLKDSYFLKKIKLLLKE